MPQETTRSERSPGGTGERARSYLTALEDKDMAALTAMTDPHAVLIQPLSFSGAPEPAVRLDGGQQVLDYLRGVTENIDRIRFTDVRVSVTGDGTTAFVQANGDFSVDAEHAYRNVYVFRLDWRNGLVVGVEEYANPITFCQTFGFPMG